MSFELNLLERAISVVAPKRAREMAASRFGFQFAGQFNGARRDKTSMRNFNPLAGSADSDSIGDLPALRARSRDLGRNAPIARGARGTTKTNVIGSGLRLKSELQREILGISDEEAEAWEDKVEVLFDLWASSKMSDVARKLNFYEQQGVAFLAAWDSGDCFVLRRLKESTSFIGLCVQLFEADRVSTPNKALNNPAGPDIRDGIEVNADGEAIAVHLLNRHPGDEPAMIGIKPTDWQRVRMRGNTGQPLMLHLMKTDRIGQSRGIPALAPVIEVLKQLDRYAEAELMAAVVSAFFTVFVKSPDGGGTGSLDPTGTGAFGGDGIPVTGTEMTLGSGTIVDLAEGEDIQIANPNRPNANFDPFFLAMIRQIGIALGMPYEVLIMHFSSSYTASKAAIETARMFFNDDRTWLSRNLCQPVYEWFLFECVSRGIIKAPGFLDDPIKRAAWCGSMWIGRAPIVLDAVKDANAAEKWIDLGCETIESITIEKNGGDWWRNQEQRGRESDLREQFKIKPAVPEAPSKMVAAEKGSQPNAGA